MSKYRILARHCQNMQMIFEIGERAIIQPRDVKEAPMNFGFLVFGIEVNRVTEFGQRIQPTPAEYMRTGKLHEHNRFADAAFAR